MIESQVNENHGEDTLYDNLLSVKQKEHLQRGRLKKSQDGNYDLTPEDASEKLLSGVIFSLSKGCRGPKINNTYASAQNRFYFCFLGSWCLEELLLWNQTQLSLLTDCSPCEEFAH